MNTKFLSALTATAAATALFSAAAPAQAASFGTTGIQFNENKTVKFDFLGSHGMFKSKLQIHSVASDSSTALAATLFEEIKRSDNGPANEWKGSPGNAVVSGPVTFTFLANQIYTFVLHSTLLDGSVTTVTSTSDLNYKDRQQAVFGGAGLLNELNLEATNKFQKAKEYTSALDSLGNGGALISFDDRGNGNDTDFQDFTVSAEAVPEPMTMTGLALGLGGLVAARRRRGNKTA